MINAYRDLLQTTNKLSYWHAVLQKADEITQRAGEGAAGPVDGGAPTHRR